MAELVLTEEEEREVHEGEAAALLLESPSFLLAIERVRQDCAEGILQSLPENQKGRENLYNLSRGLSAVTAELSTLAARAQSIIENAKLQSNPDADDVQDDAPDITADY